MISETLWLIGLASLWLGAYQDWKGRTVKNGVWLTALILAAPLIIMEAWTNPEAWAWRMATAAIVSGTAFLLWYARQVGAGDAKAIMIAALTLSPWGYWQPDAAQFVPILDALVVGLLITEAWRRLGRHSGTPFLVVLAPLTTLTAAVGGLLWWPLVWIRQAIS